jgi:hypothetical protein
MSKFKEYIVKRYGEPAEKYIKYEDAISYLEFLRMNKLEEIDIIIFRKMIFENDNTKIVRSKIIDCSGNFLSSSIYHYEEPAKRVDLFFVPQKDLAIVMFILFLPDNKSRIEFEYERETIEGKYREKILGKVILEWNGERLFIDEKEIS